MESVTIRKISPERDQEGIKRTEISTKKEWENIEEKGVDNSPQISYIMVKAPGYEP